MNRSDEQLVAAYLDDGDQRAFRLLVERHQERVFGYLVGMVRDAEAANDLFQDTYLRVIAALRKERAGYTTQGRWLAWVMRIARNAALDHMRSRKKWQNVPADFEDGFSYWDLVPDDAPALDEELHRMEQAAWLETCIDRLPPEQREVLLLRHDAELTFREIADLTDCSINTALGRMRYALLNLRKLMSGSRKEALADLGTA